MPPRLTLAKSVDIPMLDAPNTVVAAPTNSSDNPQVANSVSTIRP